MSAELSSEEHDSEEPTEELAADAEGGMADQPNSDGSIPDDERIEEIIRQVRRRRRGTLRIKPQVEAMILLVVFGLGLAGGYLVRERIAPPFAQAAPASQQDALAGQVNPPEGFKLPATYASVGPQLLRTGAIDDAKFVQLYQQANRPLTEEQLAILRQDSQAPIVINSQNAYFMLNFFWALGLVNKNPILEKGQMMAGGKAQVGNFASTGGWTIGSRAATDLYSSAEIVKLTAEQQAQVEEVANNAYRPCCGNPTSFPDCNHGMALLGLLELMASQGATVDQMFTAAKEVNAYWFPSQMQDVAVYYKAMEGKDFKSLDARKAVSKDVFSSQGYQKVVQTLAAKGLLPEKDSSGQSCGV